MECRMKTCKKCGETKDLSQFYKHKEMRDGHLNICISCKKLYAEEYRSKYSDKIKEFDRSRPNYDKRLLANRTYGRRHIKEHTKHNSKYRKNNPEKVAAHLLVAKAIREGVIVKNDYCELCGSNYKVSAHHEDYSKPLDIIWLCDTCHKKVHKEKNAIRRLAN